MTDDMRTMLTREVIEAAALSTRTFDTQVPGLALRVTPSGHRAFILRYRHLGKRREIVLGSADDLTASEARRRARKQRALLDDDHDPLAVRDQKRAEAKERASRVTLKDFAETYAKATNKKASSRRSDESILKLHIMPRLGRKAVADIGRLDAQALHDALAKTPTRANRAFALLSHMLTVASTKGYREAPLPRKCVKKNPENARDRYLSTTEHLNLWKALVALDETAHVDSAHALRLIMLTGCRKGEIVGLAWSEVDLENACLRLTDLKTGKRTIPLFPEALAILKGREPGHRSAYVFPSEDSKSARKDIEVAWRLARDTAKLTGVRIHDLRHSFAAAGIAAGLTLPEIGALLGHKAAATTARYAHVSDPVARNASNRIGARFASIVGAADGLRAVR
jgi:integrase